MSECCLLVDGGEAIVSGSTGPYVYAGVVGNLSHLENSSHLHIVIM